MSNIHPKHRPFSESKTRSRLPQFLLPLAGFAALLWFLLRVLPKPSRAAYPCQRAAAPMAAGFITWLLALGATSIAFKSARRRLRSAQYFLAGVFILAAMAAASYSFFGMPTRPAGANFTPIDSANSPMGVARGIHPGRVVWVHDPNSTSWNGTSGYFWQSNNTDQAVVDQMLAKSLVNLAGEADSALAWTQFFKYFNRTHARGDRGYQAGEKIAIKIIMSSPSSYSEASNYPPTSPQVVLALLRQLVNEAGVPADNITFYDVNGTAMDRFFNPCRAEFPQVHFVDFYGTNGREKYVADTNAPVHWSWGSGKVDEIGGGYPTYLPTCVTQADYIINLATFKGHTLAGVTLCAKNFYGSYCTTPYGRVELGMPKGAGVHPYIAAHDHSVPSDTVWYFPKRAMGTYNSLVDLMSDSRLGGKVMLSLVDGLYAARDQSYAIDGASRWTSAPFNNDWTSSIFASQDPVAIDSVCTDFLRSEPTQNQVYGNVDNFLHEAAQVTQPPSGATYDPEGDGKKPDASLGAHEHWNNAAAKLYSRNLGTGNGIELVGFSPSGNIMPSRAGSRQWQVYE